MDGKRKKPKAQQSTEGVRAAQHALLLSSLLAQGGSMPIKTRHVREPDYIFTGEELAELEQFDCSTREGLKNKKKFVRELQAKHRAAKLAGVSVEVTEVVVPEVVEA
jgi:hypothetical protein